MPEKKEEKTVNESDHWKTFAHYEFQHYKSNLHIEKFLSLIFDLMGFIQIPHDHSGFGKLINLFKVGFRNLE